MDEQKGFEFDEQLAGQLNRLFDTPSLKQLRREYLQMMDVKIDERILDLGCGTGANAIALARMLAGRCKISGIDNSKAMLAIAEKNLESFPHKDSIRLQMSDAHQLPFPERYFDVVMIIQVLEYSKDPIGLLQEAWRVLRPGGKVFVADTDWDTIVWNSGQKERTRRIVHLWSDHEADGWQGRKIYEYLNRTKFRNVYGRAFTIQETSFASSDYSYILTEIVTSYLVRSGKMNESEIQEWLGDLKEKDLANHFFFSIGRFAFLGSK